MYKKLDINELQHISKNEQVVFLDVRTPQEHASGHIPDSINIDVMSPDFSSKIGQLDKNKTYYVYCRSGARSASAASAMLNIGFSDIANMEGGMMFWKGAVASL